MGLGQIPRRYPQSQGRAGMGPFRPGQDSERRDPRLRYARRVSSGTLRLPCQRRRVRRGVRPHPRSGRPLLRRSAAYQARRDQSPARWSGRLFRRPQRSRDGDNHPPLRRPARADLMSEFRTGQPIIHFVGSIPLPDAETVFRTLAESAGPSLRRLPDGETGIRKTWIRFLQQVLAENPAIEVAADVLPFKFTQWDGKLLREIPRLRVKPGARPDPEKFDTGYAAMAIESWSLFEQLQKAGVIPATVKFQISLPTPIAPTYNNMVPSDRPRLLPALTQHLIGEVTKIAAA